MRIVCEEIIHAVHLLKIEHNTSLVDKVVTVSMGAKSEFISKPKQILECVEAADEALYEVKKSGRNAYLLRTIV